MYRNRMSNRFKYLLIGGLLTLGAAIPVQAADAARIGFVNTPEVLKKAPQASQARDRLQSEFAPRDQQLLSSANKLKDMEEKLNRDGPVMSDSERRKLERDIVSERRELKRSRDEFSEDFNIRRNEEFAKLQRRVAQAIVDLAKEEDYDLILETGVVYASDEVDITEQVIERLKR